MINHSTFIQWNNIQQLKKEQNNNIQNNMDETQIHFASERSQT